MPSGHAVRPSVQLMPVRCLRCLRCLPACPPARRGSPLAHHLHLHPIRYQRGRRAGALQRASSRCPSIMVGISASLQLDGLVPGGWSWGGCASNAQTGLTDIHTDQPRPVQRHCRRPPRQRRQHHPVKVLRALAPGILAAVLGAEEGNRAKRDRERSPSARCCRCCSWCSLDGSTEQPARVQEPVCIHKGPEGVREGHL